MMQPPVNAIEVQPNRNMKMVGRGYSVIPGQSQIMSDGIIAYINLGEVWAIIDSADVDLVKNRRWAAIQKDRQIYVCSRREYELPKSVYLHRLLLAAKKGQFVDHIDCNALNNCRSNLRFCTQAQNSKNLRTPVTNTSGFKGAFFSKEKGLWYSQIRCDGQVKRLGYFRSAIEAHNAYAAAARKYHGEFARTA